MSKTLKDRPLSRKERDEQQADGFVKSRPPRSAVRRTIHTLDVDELDELNFDTFEKM